MSTGTRGGRRSIGILAIAWAVIAATGCGFDGDEAEPGDDGPCGPGTVPCGDSCIAIGTDPDNCGSCSNACADGEGCSNGVCSPLCPGNTSLCAGACVDLQVDPQHCGDCQTACSDPPVCVNGTCLIATCSDGIENGTETAVDCGGSCPPCATGQPCLVHGDCDKPDYCVSGLCDPITSGLVGYWEMNEKVWVADCSTPTVHDSSGNGNDGIVCGGASAGNAGKIGGAGTFDGTGRVQVPASSLFDYGADDFSIAVWVNLSTLDARQPIYDGLPNVAGHISLQHESSQSATPGWMFAQRPIGTCEYAFVSEGGVTTTAGAWHHLALVRHDSSFAVLVDGVSVASNVDTSPVMSGTHVNFGWLVDSAEGLNGRLDDYRIYDRALTPDEIAALAK